MESGFVRLQLATPTNLQEVRNRLFRYAKDGMERYQSPAAKTFLVAVAGRKPRAYVFPSRLCERHRPGKNRKRRCNRTQAESRRAVHDASLWNWRSRRRTDPQHARQRDALDES